MKNVQMPKFLEGLYRDMRDRRLLIPALALVVGLLAVPILLKSHSSTSTPTVAMSSGHNASSAAEPAVVSQEMGVTQYRKRLAQLNSKNPFHQQYTQPPKSAQLHSTSTDTGSSTSSSTSSTSTSTSSTSTDIGGTGSSTPSITPATGGTPSSVGSTSTPPSSSPPATGHSPKPTLRFWTYRVGVKVGEPGKLQDRSEVKRMTMLPSKNRALAMFLGVSEDGKHAIFSISPDVDSVKGDGQCASQPSNCQYLAMQVGDKVNLHYAPGNKRYNLALTDIHSVVVGHKPPSKVKGKVANAQKFPDLGPG